MADGFFSKSAGQDRRKWLDEKAEGLMGYIPPEMRNWLQFADMMNPVSEIGRAGQSADRMMDPNLGGWERAAAGGDMLSSMAGVVGPVAVAKAAGMAPAQALQEAMLNASVGQRAGMDYMLADEAGGLRLTPRGGYAGSHTAPALEAGATLDNPADIFGDDIYGRNALQYFGTGDARLDRESIAAIQKMRNNPAAEMDIFRAMPKDAAPDINAGDWVTTSKRYAEDHGKSALDGNYQIVKERVRAGELATDGNSVHEWGWWPDDARKAAEQPSSTAQQIADMLASGRAGEVTDDMMAQADPSELWRLYQSGATGADMPMDVASRMQRAEGMGFDTGTDLYHGTGVDATALQPSRRGAQGAGVYTTDSPDAASFYARDYGRDETVYPLNTRGDYSKNTMKDTSIKLGPDGTDMDYGFRSDRVINDPTNIRSKFARFDPRLKHLANLSAGGAGVAYMGNEDDNKAQIRAWLEAQQ